MKTVHPLQSTLHELIPLSRAMGIEVEALEAERLVLTAPLELNHNHAGTGFAGSLYSLASLAGWAMLRHLVDRHEQPAELVLGEARIRYLAPLARSLRAEVVVSLSQQNQLIETLRAGKAARLQLEVVVPDPLQPCARFSGTYFAKPKQADAPA